MVIINNEIDQIESEIKVLESELVLNDENSDICIISVDAGDESADNDEGCVENQLLNSQIVLLDEAKQEIEKAKQSLEDNNLLDAIKSVAVVQEIIVELKNSTEKDVNSNSDETAPSEATTDDDSSDEVEGEVKGETDSNDEEEVVESNNKVAPVSI